jgi:hypothetical protein
LAGRAAHHHFCKISAPSRQKSTHVRLFEESGRSTGLAVCLEEEPIMAGALVRLLACLVALSTFAAVARCESASFYPLSGAMARADLADVFRAHPFIAGAPSIGFSGFGEADPRTIHALTDEDEALLTRRFFGAAENDTHEPGDGETHPASLRIAAAFGAALQELAALWDPRLTLVLIWLFFLSLLLRPPRQRPEISKAESED